MRRSLIVLFAAAFLVAGCSRSSFVGRGYDNFTAYYNTFYNAENAYEEGVEGLERADQPVDRTRYLPLFTVPDRASGAQAFNDAIEKSADVLREHPGSKWVDDALLLIGKSYFYLQNYVGAEQKFREVMTLESKLDGEARFWLARTLIAAGQFEAAAEHLQESLSREDVPRRWRGRLQLAQGELAVKREDWETAANELEAGLEATRDNELGARAQFLLGQVYETLGRHEAAVEAYRRVQDYNPLYQLGYAAQVSAVRAEGEYGDADEALRLLRRMERDDKNYDNRAELAYLRGRIYQAADRRDDALGAYYDLLYDSDANISAVSGPAYYALGELFRDAYNDYPLAAAYFDTAATRLGSMSGSSRGARAVAEEAYAPEAITDGAEQKRVFGGFRDAVDAVARMDSLLALGDLDDEAFQTFVLDLRRQRAEELAEQRRQQERRQAEEEFGRFSEAGGVQQQEPATSTAGSGQAGFLYHREPVRVQQVKADFIQRWGDRPLVPNWRRQNALSGATASARGTTGVSGTDPVRPGVNSPQLGLETLPEVDVTDVPRTQPQRTALRNARAVGRYEVGNVLFLAMNRPDSAAAWYRMVIEDDPDQPVSQRAYYALAEVQLALGDTAAADRLYRTIAEQYPRSDFAARARERLGLVQPEETVQADTLALANAAYESAYATWQAGAYPAALDAFVETALRYDETPVAPRALLAAGTLYLEWSRRDSLDLFAPLPLTLPDSTLLAAELMLRPEAPEPPREEPPRKELPREETPADSVGTSPEAVSASPDSAGTPQRPPALTDPVAVDSVTVDSLGTASLTADSVRAGRVANDRIADSTAALNAAAVPADTLSARPVADSTIALPDPEPVGLERLYTYLTEQYNRTPESEQARRVLAALEERKPKPPPLEAEPSPAGTAAGTTAAAPDPQPAGSEEAAETPAGEGRPIRSDALVQQELAERRARLARETGEEEANPARPRRLVDDERADEVGEDAAQSPAEAPGDSTRAPVISPPPPASSTDPPADPETAARARTAAQAGQWTIAAFSAPSVTVGTSVAQQIRLRLGNAEQPVDVFAVPGAQGERYLVGVGLFESEEAAASVVEALRDRLPPAAAPEQLPVAPEP